MHDPSVGFCPDRAILKEFLDQELNEYENDEDRATLTAITATYEEHKETLIDVINDLARYFYIANCQIQYLK